MKQAISDISAFGCHVSTQQMWPVGSQVKIEILHENRTFSASARIIYDRPLLGMGIAFTDVDPENQAVVELWIAGLRKAMQRPTAD